MNFQKLVKTRYSVRGYRPDPVEDKKLQKILEAVRLAPTAHNVQPFQLIVIHTQGKEAELGRIFTRPWFTQAPIVIAICGLPSQAWVRKDGKNYCDVDVTIAMDHLIMAATDLGLGTCWIGAFDPAAAREVLGLPPEVEPIVFTPLGYPSLTSPNTERAAAPKKRKPLEEIVRYEHW